MRVITCHVFGGSVNLFASFSSVIQAFSTKKRNPKMFCKRFCSWLVFFGLACFLRMMSAYSTDPYIEEVDPNSDEVRGLYYFKKNAEDPEDLEGNRIGVDKRDPSFTPYISVGALSNMQQFFQNLKENLDLLEKFPVEEKSALLEKLENTAETEARAFRPPATAAYLHAIRNQRPSQKIRNFVSNAEPLTLRGSNSYDPSYLWSGLGRRR